MQALWGSQNEQGPDSRGLAVRDWRRLGDGLEFTGCDGVGIGLIDGNRSADDLGDGVGAVQADPDVAGLIDDDGTSAALVADAG